MARTETMMSTDTAERPAIVRTKALSKTYPGGVQAVIELDMEIRAGEIYGFLGPNGAGKSTTIGMLTTRVTPTGGEAEVGGVDIIRPARRGDTGGEHADRRQIGRAHV